MKTIVFLIIFQTSLSVMATEVITPCQAMNESRETLVKEKVKIKENTQTSSHQ